MVAFFEGRDEAFEVVLVNDGGEDGSWEVIRDLAKVDPRIVAVRFLRNYGQHNANLAGFAEARGDLRSSPWTTTCQNPAPEIAALIETADDRGPRRRLRPLRPQEELRSAGLSAPG